MVRRQGHTSPTQRYVTRTYLSQWPGVQASETISHLNTCKNLEIESYMIAITEIVPLTELPLLLWSTKVEKDGGRRKKGL